MKSICVITGASSGIGKEFFLSLNLSLVCTHLISSLATKENIREIARIVSEEIEYSEDNIEAIKNSFILNDETDENSKLKAVAKIGEQGYASLQAAIDAAKAKLDNDELKVFDTKTFTVGGKELTTYLADVVDLGDFAPDTEAIVDGRFIESEKRSAPYFNVIIDGITVPAE